MQINGIIIINLFFAIGTLKEDMSKLTKEMTNLNISLKKDIMENIRLGLDDRRLQLEDAEKLVSTLEILLSDVEADLKERVSITKRSLLKNNSVKVLAETERKLKNLLLDCLKARENALGKFHQEIKFIDQMESSMRNNTNFLRETFLKFFKVDSADYSNAEHPIFLKDQLYFHLFDFLRNIQIFNQFPQNYIIGLLEIIRRDLFSNLFSAKISFLFEKGPSQLLEMEMKQRERFQNVAVLFPSSFLPSLIEADNNNLPDRIHLPSDINFSDVIPGKRHMITLETMKEYREVISVIKCSKMEEQMILKKLQGTLDKIFGYFERMSKDMNSIMTQALLKAPERLKSSNESRLQSATHGTSPIAGMFSRKTSSDGTS